MIRLAASHARNGMELALPIVDASGNSVYDAGTLLDAERIAKLPLYGVREIFIADPLLDDIPVNPSFHRSWRRRQPWRSRLCLRKPVWQIPLNPS